MKRILQTFLFFSCFAFLLSSCKTVNELPTQPSEQISQTETSEAAFSTPTQAQTETVNSSRDIGHIGLGIESGWSADDVSAYMDYTGGEMTLPIFLESSGRVQTVGIGILLFLDGKPQPYRLEGESEYTYLHIFYPTSSRILENLYLTPVSGEVGESPDLYVMSLLRPDYYPSQGPANTMTYTGRFRCCRTPPEYNGGPRPGHIPGSSRSLTEYSDNAEGLPIRRCCRLVSGRFSTTE